MKIRRTPWTIPSTTAFAFTCTTCKREFSQLNGAKVQEAFSKWPKTMLSIDFNQHWHWPVAVLWQICGKLCGLKLISPKSCTTSAPKMLMKSAPVRDSVAEFCCRQITRKPCENFSNSLTCDSGKATECRKYHPRLGSLRLESAWEKLNKLKIR